MRENKTMPIPLWLLTNKSLSPLAKWTYVHLLQLQQELCEPGRSGLVINIHPVSQEIFPTYAWTEKHLLDAFRELTNKGVIASRKLAYPSSTPEHWEVEFLKESE